MQAGIGDDLINWFQFRIKACRFEWIVCPRNDELRLSGSEIGILMAILTHTSMSMMIKF